jgi:hypothetical protein
MHPRYDAGGLSANQQRVLAAFVICRREHGRPPTCRWLASKLGYAHSKSVVDHLRALDRKGMVKFGRGETVATDKGYAVLGLPIPCPSGASDSAGSIWQNRRGVDCRSEAAFFGFGKV